MAIRKLLLVAGALLLFPNVSLFGQDNWPCFRHDGQLTGSSPLKGGFSDPPRQAWTVSLGAKDAPQEKLLAEDVDGDGLDEILVVGRTEIRCLGRDGQPIWICPEFPNPKVETVADFAGDGTRGLLVWTDSGVEKTRYIVSGKSGKATKLYSMRNVFGGSDRIGKILPKVPGQQLCAWWSADAAAEVWTASGYFFSFENGVENPVCRFTKEVTGTICAPQHFFSDVDRDGEPEMVMISHQQAWVYNLQTGEEEMYLKWPMIRTYSAWLAVAVVKPGAPPSILSVNPHIPGTERVDFSEGKATVVWKDVAGGVEDQYQTQVKISAGAPDPFLDLAGNGHLSVAVNITNEKGDGKTYTAILDAEAGTRVFERVGIEILCIDDLDEDGVPEILIREDESLRITHWDGADVFDLWRGEGVSPLLVPLPSERDLGRNRGGSTPVWRLSPGSDRFLLYFPEGVFACSLQGGELVRHESVTKHAALGNQGAVPRERVTVDRGVAVVAKDEDETFRYEALRLPTYMAPPPVVGDLDGERRVLVLGHERDLLSFSAKGGGEKTIAQDVYGDVYSIVDVDGDGANEVVTCVADEDGQTACVILDASGRTERRIATIPHATTMRLGPTGRFSGGKGRWVVIAYDMEVGHRPCVAAYDGSTGRRLWIRDHFEGISNDYPAGSQVKFVLHLPAAVFDYDGNGSDDLIAESENFYGIVDVENDRDLAPVAYFSNCVPGHWQAYAHPIIARFRGLDRPDVFHHRAFAQTILTDLEGDPIWHWGLTRDTTPQSWPGIADLDGDGTIEIVQSQIDGWLRAFDSSPLDLKCPRCPEAVPLSPSNHSGLVRWEKRFEPPLSDLVSFDAKGDGSTEVLFGAGNGHLYAVGERDGQPAILWRHPLGRAVGSPVVADVDLDGEPEILVPVEDGTLACLLGKADR